MSWDCDENNIYMIYIYTYIYMYIQYIHFNVVDLHWTASSDNFCYFQLKAHFYTNLWITDIMSNVSGEKQKRFMSVINFSKSIIGCWKYYVPPGNKQAHEQEVVEALRGGGKCPSQLDIAGDTTPPHPTHTHLPPPTSEPRRLYPSPPFCFGSHWNPPGGSGGKCTFTVSPGVPVWAFVSFNKGWTQRQGSGSHNVRLMIEPMDIILIHCAG